MWDQSEILSSRRQLNHYHIPSFPTKRHSCLTHTLLNASCAVPPSQSLCSLPVSVLKPFSKCCVHSFVCQKQTWSSTDSEEYGSSINTQRYYTALHVASNCHSSCIIRGRRLRKLKMHSVPTDNSQMRLAIVSLNSLKNSSSYKSPLTSYPRSLARTIYTCSASCCFCKGNPCIPHS